MLLPIPYADIKTLASTIPECVSIRDELMAAVKVHCFPKTLQEGVIPLMNNTSPMLVDPEVVPKFNKFTWKVSEMGYPYYVNEQKERVYAHRILYRSKYKYQTKYRLDLRKSNFKRVPKSSSS